MIAMKTLAPSQKQKWPRLSASLSFLLMSGHLLAQERPTAPPPLKDGIGEDIRWVFISFLFALVISEIAAKCGRLLLSWKEAGRGAFPTFSHLILAAVVVATSWLGWSLAIKHGFYTPIEETMFEASTMSLILDLMLLTLYYALVFGIRVPNAAEPQVTSPRHISFWTMVIFIGYLVWDLVTAGMSR